jgi:hypothetical protein
MEPPRRAGLDAIRVPLMIAAAAANGAVALAIESSWATDEVLRRDYRVFWDAGKRLLEGRLEGIYDAQPGGFPFLHPPPVIVLSAPLGTLEPRTAYAILTALSIAALIASALALRALRPRAGEHDLVWLAAVTSAPWLIAVILGQPAAFFLALWLLGLAALERERPLASGLVLGMLFVKPPLALAGLALGIRRPSVALGMLATAGLLALISLPAGLARWPEWLEALGRVGGELASGELALWKQHTLLASLESVAPAPVAWLGWTLAALPLGALTLRAIGRVSVLRAGGLLVLATLALTPYAYYYDALLLAVPGACLWLERERYPRRARRVIAAIACATFAWQHAAFFVLQAEGPPLAGALVSAWLGAELWATERARREHLGEAPAPLC